MNNIVKLDKLFFVGAGSTAALSFPVTGQQESRLLIAASLSKNSYQADYYENVARELIGGNSLRWLNNALADLIQLADYTDVSDCFDGKPDKQCIDIINEHRPNNWTDDDSKRLFYQIRELYNWQVLKEAVLCCPNYDDCDDGHFVLNDLYNLFDFHLKTGRGIRLNGRNVAVKDVEKARALLLLIQYIQMYAAWRNAVENKHDLLTQYYEFAQILGKIMQKEGFDRERLPLKSREFYLMSYGIISMNYDPVFLMMIMCANKSLNDNAPYIGCPPQQLKLFNDFSYFMACHPLGEDQKQENEVWYPMNEPAAQRLNDQDHESRRVRIGKFLMTHGMVGMRECPNCGLVTNYIGNKWEYDSSNLILPPLLFSFVPPNINWKSRVDGHGNCLRPDQTICPHCGDVIGIENLVMDPQSLFKKKTSPILEDINRDMLVLLMNCRHVILFGYSLPKDDVEFRAILAARLQRSTNNEAESNEADKVRCSVVVGTKGEKRWIYKDEIGPMLKDKDERRLNNSSRDTLLQAVSIFGLENVRYYGGGIPDVFTGGTQHAQRYLVENLLNWDSCN